MRSLLLASSAAIVAACVVFGCGTVTGLSDDFQFVDDASGTDGPASSSGGPGDGGGDAPSDAPKDSGQQSCSVQQTMQASEDISSANGDKLPTGCALCLSAMCCPDVLSCFGNSACRSAMSCVFNCQNSGSAMERQQCVNQCQNLSSFDGVSSCEANACKSTCGQFRP